MTQAAAGLEDVVAGVSEICFLDGVQGRLLYRGYDVHDLAAHSTFEEVVYLLWHGDLPTRAQLAALNEQLAADRPLPPAVVDVMRAFPHDAQPMDVLRTAVSALAMWDPELLDDSPEANLRKAVRLTARIPTIVAVTHRLRTNQPLVDPDPKLNTAQNILYMLHGKRASELNEHTMDVALILHADHELNASTFAARVTAATLARIYDAITSAIGALSGPLHGGANEQVMRMLQRIKTPDRVESYLKEALDRKEKIMGFGHRVYRTEDPRATHLRQLSKQQGEVAGQPQWWQMSRQIEDSLKESKGLLTNVDFYSASTYYLMDIPIDLFTPIFACSRISGWTAHVLEQYANNRLIRPRADYTGPPYPQRFLPLDQR
jgi:citrate synthase